MRGVLYDVLRRSQRLRAGVRFLKRIRRLTFEYVGSDHYSHPSYLDRLLASYLPERGGVFVEAGAFDGYSESTTYWFERFRQWSGVLIEPVPALAAEARRQRPRSQVFQCALVPFGFESGSIKMWRGGTMSVVAGARGSPDADKLHALQGADLESEVISDLTVPARTLSAVLDDANIDHIDLLSLDVEGYEVSVLRGLDLGRHRPRFILVEMLDRDRQQPEIEEVLGSHYAHEAQLSARDHLYRRADNSTDA